VSLIHSYLQYLELCSKALRNCLKEPHKAAAAKRGDFTIKHTSWQQGKPTNTGTLTNTDSSS
jgi:hypothetical protein